MIDVENLVFSTVFDGIQAALSGVTVTKGYDEEKAVFPCVVVRETNNAPYQFTDTDDCAENYTRVTYQVDVYSDKEGTARGECRKLIVITDGIMQGMKFRRTYMGEPVNIQRTIYRQTARFTAIVRAGITTVTADGGVEKTVTTFQVYRR